MRSQVTCISCGRPFFTAMKKVKGVTPKIYVPENNACQGCRNLMTMTQQKRTPTMRKLEDENPKPKKLKKTEMGIN